ncbi:GNAT family N-acetyltransferase [Halomonas lysinitropha]
MAKEKDILGALADGLPKFDIYRQNWDTARTNWLPFYWRGFEQTTRYTYVLTDLSDLDAVWQGTQSDIKSNIRKAKNRFGIRIRFTEDMGELIPLIRKTFERQNIRLPFSEQFLHHVDEAAASKGNRAIILGEDVGGRLHAGTYIVWEADTAYQLLNGYDPDLRESGAGSLCVWSAILKAAQHVNRYDFEGSMLEPVERFFRAFGAKQVPYFQVSRTQSRLLKTAICLRSLIRSGK